MIQTYPGACFLGGVKPPFSMTDRDLAVALGSPGDMSLNSGMTGISISEGAGGEDDDASAWVDTDATLKTLFLLFGLSAGLGAMPVCDAGEEGLPMNENRLNLFRRLAGLKSEAASVVDPAAGRAASNALRASSLCTKVGTRDCWPNRTG